MATTITKGVQKHKNRFSCNNQGMDRFNSN